MVKHARLFVTLHNCVKEIINYYGSRLPCNVIKAPTVLNSENDDCENEYCYNKIVTQASMSETDMVSFCYQIACGMVRVLCNYRTLGAYCVGS